MMDALLDRLGISSVNSGVYADGWIQPDGDQIVSINPTTGEPIAAVQTAGRADYDNVVGQAQASFHQWQTTPAPQRGEIIRQLGIALRQHKDDLGDLVSLEVGKIRSEGAGEVQALAGAGASEGTGGHCGAEVGLRVVDGLRLGADEVLLGLPNALI